MIEESIVKDPALAPEGRRKIDWVAQHAPVLNAIFEERLSDGSLDGRKIAMTIHLEAKTAYLAILLSEAGAEVTVSGSNPLSTQDDVCAALAERGVRVFATHDPSEDEFEEFLLRTIETGPEIIIDDGAELVSRMILHRPDLLEGVIGASEETTTGILKLRAMDTEQALTFPVLAANDARMKHLFDNRYGTGHSSIVSLLSNTNLFLSGKTVVVMGFGWVGRGLAKYAKGMGARVVVCEPEPVKLLEAYAEGYEAMNSLAAAEIGDVFITGTGNLKVLGSEHFTHGGLMMGTPAYMAPEQVSGQVIDARADLYSMGVVFYRLISGRLPFVADTAIAMAQKQMSDAPTLLRVARCPAVAG